MDNDKLEGLHALSIYLLFVSAVALPFIISWLTRAFYKRLKRLDKVLGIIEDNERYYEKEQKRDQ